MHTRRLILLLAATAAALHGAAPATIAGRVTDSEGAAISGALVLLHPDAAGEIPPLNRPEVRRETDDNGQFDAPVQPGFYDVCVLATAFAPDCRKILVTDGQTVRRNVRLKMDKLVAERLGHRYADR